mmetsp:Transcript_37312/g.97039  ORF Transcript_37312/g.97039 Transcript_37312/m.97039 type:complete len:164 (+) Transcript_37312:516-1007(+)
MTCPQCRYEWCWECVTDWRVGRHGFYGNCRDPGNRRGARTGFVPGQEQRRQQPQRPNGNQAQGGCCVDTCGTRPAVDLTQRDARGRSQGPLTREELARMPTFNGAPRGAEPCPICMSELSQGQSLRMLPCFHVFCAECIDTHLTMEREQPFCPTCRMQVRDGI